MLIQEPHSDPQTWSLHMFDYLWLISQITTYLGHPWPIKIIKGEFGRSCCKCLDRCLEQSDKCNSHPELRRLVPPVAINHVARKRGQRQTAAAISPPCNVSNIYPPCWHGKWKCLGLSCQAPNTNPVGSQLGTHWDGKLHLTGILSCHCWKLATQPCRRSL